MNIEEIDKIKRQFATGLWPQFLESIEINNLRGFHGETINFNFPIVAVVGENGSGKSTLLKSVACAYDKDQSTRHFYPSKLFLDTQWDKMTNVSISFRIKRDTQIDTSRISKPKARWNFPEKKFIRDVFIFDVSRTLPLDATVGYAKLAKQSTLEASSKELDDENLKWLSYVLGKEYKLARLTTTDVSSEKEVGILEREFGEFSQFHQGAGEDTTLNLFMVFQSIPNNSLLIIDEVEASLHPRAQRRLISYFLWLCRKKKLQILLSTHSPYIIDELPLEARILLMPSHTGLNVIYSSSTEFAMSRIDDKPNIKLFLFVEDNEAKTLLREIILSSNDADEILPQISIDVVGPANVVTFLGQLSFFNKLPYLSLGVLDGDMPDSDGCIKLPGTEAPEKSIFTSFKRTNWSNLENRFGIGAGELYDVLNDSVLDPNHHNWCRQIGNKIKLGSRQVWDIIVNEWVKQFLDDTIRDAIINEILSKLR